MSSSMDDAIDRMINTATYGSNQKESIFIPSSTFQGEKPGYYFGTNEPYGTGYHLDHYSKTTLSPPAKKQKTGKDLLEEAEKQQTHPSRIIQLTEFGLKTATQGLKKSILQNEILRAQNPNQPETFMESELSLHDEITAWKAIATSMELYPYMIKLGTLKSLLNLMHHENNDVAISVLSLFMELIDTELIPSQKAKYNMALFVNEFLKEGGLELVIDNLFRLNTDIEDEATAIDDTLTLIESILDLDTMKLSSLIEEPADSAVTILLSQTTLLGWLFSRIQQPTQYSIPLHSSEILANILQQEDAKSFVNNIQIIANYSSSFDTNPKTTNIDGMEILLQAVATYRKKNPITEEECEYLQNCFHILSASMLHSSNVLSFLDAQGPELMLRCIREKVHAGGSSLHVLYFLLSGSDANTKKACDYFIQAGGLSILFPLIMGRRIPKPALCSDAGQTQLIQKAKESNKVSKRAKRAIQAKKEWMQQIESNVIQILYSLTRHIDDDSPYDAKDRLIVKFVENDCEKCDRLIELCLKYDEKMRLAEAKYYMSDAAEEAENLGMDVDLAALDAKLKAGGDLFHCLGAICAFASIESKRCHEHIMEQLKVKNSGISLIKASLEEFASILDDGLQKKQLTHYLTMI